MMGGTFTAHDGNTYQGPPPEGWWQATDGRWNPAESHPNHQAPPPQPQQWAPPPDRAQVGPPVHDGGRPWWKKKRFLIPIGVVALIGIIGSLADDTQDGDATETAAANDDEIDTEPTSPATQTTVETTTTETTASTTTTAATLPSPTAPDGSYPSFDDQDPILRETFLFVLGSNSNVLDLVGDVAAYDAAIVACRGLDSGDEPVAIALALMANLNDPSASGALLGSGVEAFCPHHSDMMTEFFDALTG